MILFDIRVTTTVNWLGAPRCLRQMKWCSEQEETRSIASAQASKATMFLTERVVDLSPMGAQKQKILSKDGIFCFIQYLSLVKWGKFPMICTFKAFFGKIVLNKAQLNILMSRV